MHDIRRPRAPLDRIPPDILCAADYETVARAFIDPATLAYIAGGSGDERSLAANRQAFARRGVLPRLLRDVCGGHTRTALLGRPRAHPLLLAPVACQGLVHAHGEVHSARGAEATDTVMVASTLASCPLEEVAAVGGPRWFQLYMQPSREVTADLVRRAERVGFEAIVLTVDAPVQSPGRAARRAGFTLPESAGTANLAGYPAPEGRVLAPTQSRILDGMMREAPTAADLAWLMDVTGLPVLVKGVLRADDARALQRAGVAGLIVSNHGGRALDGVPASLDVLAAVRAAVGPGYPVLLDSGIRAGSDVFTALALGADAVLVGRLQMYALAVAGALGVAHMIRLLREELELCMALAGCATLADITPDLLCEAAPC
ncbi:alpha-hydroxy-acid oxidizing protein [Nitrogeniibacter mangrovi]|uniref:Alpha-hydroxy-acid oxidizing protein n=1 Tax=Nitrogeniibacter mangrovi TaxID=2016596 RepID=A0A6C1B794_9RHOO|nr:alpha-hydroxy acid oxidase [Nitrogeniibacter mangrovi]QID18829.1 alpha-hydroxy-acid oxidizing protein [Nitrogeniibacter mangrovi]